MLTKSIYISCLSFYPSIHLVCKEAKADLAFLVDGSWSIGDDNFMKITRFLYSTMGSLDLIGPDGTQVSHVTTLTPRTFYPRETVSEEELHNKTAVKSYLHASTVPTFPQMRH